MTTLPHTVTAANGAAYGCMCSIGEDHEQVASTLTVWTVYRSPADFPSVPYVVRAWVIAGPTPIDAGALGFADTLDEARSMLPEGLVRIQPSPGDDPVVVESWM